MLTGAVEPLPSEILFYAETFTQRTRHPVRMRTGFCEHAHWMSRALSKGQLDSPAVSAGSSLSLVHSNNPPMRARESCRMQKMQSNHADQLEPPAVSRDE